MPLSQEKLSVLKIWPHGRSFFHVMLRWRHKMTFYENLEQANVI
jgi:hypothetical protein